MRLHIASKSKKFESKQPFAERVRSTVWKVWREQIFDLFHWEFLLSFASKTAASLLNQWTESTSCWFLWICLWIRSDSSFSLWQSRSLVVVCYFEQLNWLMRPVWAGSLWLRVLLKSRSSYYLQLWIPCHGLVMDFQYGSELAPMMNIACWEL